LHLAIPARSPSFRTLSSFKPPWVPKVRRMGLSRTLSLTSLLAAIFITAGAHGFVTQPRQRGALKTQRSVVPKIMDPNAPIDYCPHCQNSGGIGKVKAGGPWKPYKPFEYKRRGITMCGDPVGNSDHSSKGKFANPSSTLFAASYAPGGVANFECMSNFVARSSFVTSLCKPVLTVKRIL
jgi:hypothetical protein